MGSDANKMNDATSFHSSDPTPCATGCGFFGTAATMNLCSKCFRDRRIKDELVNNLVNKVVSFPPQISSSISSFSSPADSLETTAVSSSSPVDVNRNRNRCLTCNKKVGVVGFKCRCGETFCGSHRYPEEHDCEFDFKRTGRDAIIRENPVIKADKLNRI